MDIQHRINGEVYFVTDTVVDWVDIFTRPIYKHIVIESLQYCQEPLCCRTIASCGNNIKSIQYPIDLFLLHNQ